MFDQVVLELRKSVHKSAMKDSRQETLLKHLFKDLLLVIIMLAKNIQMKFILKSLMVEQRVKWPF